MKISTRRQEFLCGQVWLGDIPSKAKEVDWSKKTVQVAQKTAQQQARNRQQHRGKLTLNFASAVAAVEVELGSLDVAGSEM